MTLHGLSEQCIAEIDVGRGLRQMVGFKVANKKLFARSLVFVTLAAFLHRMVGGSTQEVVVHERWRHTRVYT